MNLTFSYECIPAVRTHGSQETPGLISRVGYVLRCSRIQCRTLVHVFVIFGLRKLSLRNGCVVFLVGPLSFRAC